MIRGTYARVAGGCVLFGAITAALNVVFGRHGFDNYDMGPMVDAGWRVYSGQVPGRDFLAVFPPSHYLLAALFFRIFGVSWKALVLGSSCFFGAITLLGLRLAALVHRVHGEDAAIWVALVFTAGQAIFLLPYSIVWHATIAMDFALYGVCAVYVLVGEGPAWVRREAMGHLTLAIAGLMLSKGNTAYPAVALCLIAAAMGGARKRWLALVAGGGVLLAGAALWPVHVSLLGMLAAYRGLSGRLLPVGFLYAILYYRNNLIALANLLVYAILAPALSAAFVTAWGARAELKKSAVAVLGVGSISIAVLAMGTNIQFKLSDTPLMLLGFVLLGARSPRRRLAMTVVALSLVAVYFGGTRLAFVAGSDWNAESCAHVAFHDTFLGDMTGCEVMRTALSEVDRTLMANPHARVFFGSGLEFLYAGRRISSPMGMPNWWHPGTSYPVGESSRIVEDWKRDRFDVLIFNADEYREQMPAGIGEAIDRAYIRVDGTTAIHVYKAR